MPAVALPDEKPLRTINRDSDPTFTVAICTHNRARLLDATLRSVTASARPVHHQLEVLVIANACTDDTDRVVERYRPELPVRVVHEPRAGHSHARNAAVQHARGRLIIWTDDDVRVRPRWLTAYERALASWPDARILGGAILPVFEGGPSEWLAESFHLCESAWAARSVPLDGPIDVASGGFPYGANFAIDGDAQRARTYDTRLGRQPGRWMVGGEELDVIRSVLSEGGSGRWVADSVVEHIIERDRQTVSYLRAYFEGHGYVLGLDERRAEHRMPSLIEELRAMAGLELKFRWAKTTRAPTVWVPALIETAIARGKFSGRRAAQALAADP